MIFLSYSREDTSSACMISRTLAERGVPVIRDPAAVHGDAFWRSQVRRSLEQSSVMLVLWSRHASQSPWVDEEVRHFSGPQHFLSLDSAEPPAARLMGEARSAGAARQLIAMYCGEGRTENDPFDTPRKLIPGSHDNRAPDTGDLDLARRQALVAAEARLTRFRQALGRRVCSAKRLDPRRCLLESGEVAVRLPPGIDGTRGFSVEVYLSTVPVTNEQYGRFVKATGYPDPPTWHDERFCVPAAPVVGVTWFEAAAYAAWIGGDLPTEPEWEWAATGGGGHLEYATADGRLTDDQALFGRPLAEGAPVPGSAYQPNPLGFYGMCGNTWDWCASLAGAHRVIRGGGYMDSPRFCTTRIAYRNAPIDRDCCVGFRVAIPIAAQKQRRTQQ